MFTFLSDFFQNKGIDLLSALPLTECRLQKPHLLERAGITDGTVFLIAVPYFTPACAAADRNLSAYAVSRDYHGFFAELFDELLPLLQKIYPNERFACFADHSPIDERDAAARTGLGIIGRNGLLITEKYSSYVFLGEVVTSAKIETPTPVEIRTCEDCGKCQRACPMAVYGECLSALTQKKGELSEAETAYLLRYGSVWGCDICQEVCPHTQRAIKSESIYTKIPYFLERPIPHLTSEILCELSNEEFSRRAYAWRGKQTILRNLLLTEREKSR